MSSIFAVSMMMTVSAMLTGLCDVDTGVRTSLTVSLCLLAMSLRDHEIREPETDIIGCVTLDCLSDILIDLKHNQQVNLFFNSMNPIYPSIDLGVD